MPVTLHLTEVHRKFILRNSHEIKKSFFTLGLGRKSGSKHYPSRFDLLVIGTISGPTGSWCVNPSIRIDTHMRFRLRCYCSFAYYRSSTIHIGIDLRRLCRHISACSTCTRFGCSGSCFMSQHTKCNEDDNYHQNDDRLK